MRELSGSWTAETPFGALELHIETDGSFRLGSHRGVMHHTGDGLRVEYSADPVAGLGQGHSQSTPLPLPQGDSWWVPLPDSGGVLRFLRHSRAGQRSLDFPSGLRLSVPPNWHVRPAPGALSAHPPEAVRAGLPSAAFVEIYETLLPRNNEDHLLAAMNSMLAERTRQEPDVGSDQRDLAGLKTHVIHSTASLPTGERMQVKLWVTGTRDHLLAVAQANLEGESFISDANVEAIISSSRWPEWTRAESFFGSWLHIERKPSGPLTEVIERQLHLSPDGGYRRTRSSSLELPDESDGQPARPKEVKERIGQWYSRDGELMLSAGLRGYRVRKAKAGSSRDELFLDNTVWNRTE